MLFELGSLLLQALASLCAFLLFHLLWRECLFAKISLEEGLSSLLRRDLLFVRAQLRAVFAHRLPLVECRRLCALTAVFVGVRFFGCLSSQS